MFSIQYSTKNSEIKFQNIKQEHQYEETSDVIENLKMSKTMFGQLRLNKMSVRKVLKILWK